MSDLAEIKLRMRRAIHGRLAVPALFSFGLIQDVPITVRWGNRIDTTGGLDNSYGEIIDGIDRLIFLDSDIAAVNAARAIDALPPVVLQRTAQITIPQYKNARFGLDQLSPSDGPEETVWVVTRLRG